MVRIVEQLIDEAAHLGNTFLAQFAQLSLYQLLLSLNLLLERLGQFFDQVQIVAGFRHSLAQIVDRSGQFELEALALREALERLEQDSQTTFLQVGRMAFSKAGRNG